MEDIRYEECWDMPESESQSLILPSAAWVAGGDTCRSEAWLWPTAPCAISPEHLLYGKKQIKWPKKRRKSDGKI